MVADKTIKNEYFRRATLYGAFLPGTGKNVPKMESL